VIDFADPMTHHYDMEHLEEGILVVVLDHTVPCHPCRERRVLKRMVVFDEAVAADDDHLVINLTRMDEVFVGIPNPVHRNQVYELWQLMVETYI